MVECHKFFVTRIRIRFAERQTVLVGTVSVWRGRMVRVAVGGHDNIVMMDEGGGSGGNKTDRVCNKFINGRCTWLGRFKEPRFI